MGIFKAVGGALNQLGVVSENGQQSTLTAGVSG